MIPQMSNITMELHRATHISPAADSYLAVVIYIPVSISPTNVYTRFLLLSNIKILVSMLSKNFKIMIASANYSGDGNI